MTITFFIIWISFKVMSAFKNWPCSIWLSTIFSTKASNFDDVEFKKSNDVWEDFANIFGSGGKAIVKTKGGNWKSFDCGASSSNIIGSKIVVSESTGYKWINKYS